MWTGVGEATATLGGVSCVGSGACEVALAIAGGALLGYEAWIITDYIYNMGKGLPATGKPKDAPTGTIPINQVKPRLSKELIHEIRDGIGAGPRDWVGIEHHGGPETFTLSLRLRHPTSDLAPLASELSLLVGKVWKAGDLIRNADGALTGSVRSTSYLSSRLTTSSDLELFSPVRVRIARDRLMWLAARKGSW